MKYALKLTNLSLNFLKFSGGGPPNPPLVFVVNHPPLQILYLRHCLLFVYDSLEEFQVVDNNV